MPRDNHPRERQTRALERKKPKRPPFERVLIVTEGSKTERLYLEEIRKQKKIATANIAILASEGTEPLQVVQYAVDQFNASKEFEAVYAVFDRDSHRTYHNALARARALDGTLKNRDKQKVRFFAVPTVPCFELWLLLHFEDVFAFGDRHEVIRNVMRCIPGYAKGMRGVYSQTEPKFAEASQRAAQLRARHSADLGSEPYTDMDMLTGRLRSIRA